MDYVAWCWKGAASTTTISAGTVGNDDASNVRANTAAGFSIVEWSSSGGARTVAHGLNSAPELIIIKKTASSSPYSVYATAVGNDKRLQLNETAAAATDNMWNNTHPTSVVFTQQISGGATTDNIGYCFHSVSGYQKVGSYTWTGTSNTAGTLVTGLGFTPRFVMIKGTDIDSNWMLYDNQRVSGTQSFRLAANISDAEDQVGYQGIIFDSDGFSAGAGADGNVTGSDGLNKNGKTYIFLAIA